MPKMPKTKTKPLPFHTDLNGRERVNRAFARKAWSWGLPVWQDSGKGARRLMPPDYVDEDRLMFNITCLEAMGLDGSRGYLTETERRKCIYLIPYGTMGVHFEFTDGSNPFVKYGTAVELIHEVWAWSRSHGVKPKYQNDSDGGSIAYFTLEPFQASVPPLFPPEGGIES